MLNQKSKIFQKLIIEEQTAKELISRAKVSRKKNRNCKKIERIRCRRSIDKFTRNDTRNARGIGDQNIKKLKDFAELASDELIGGVDEIKGKKIKINGYLEDFALSKEEADNLIMSARKIVFKD